jgi:hypothetical protein
MKIQQNDYERIKKICNHEAGHYIVASENLFKTHGISTNFSFPQGHSGESVIDPWIPNIKTIIDTKKTLNTGFKSCMLAQ